MLAYVLMRVQGHLPLDPVGLPGVNQYVSFNTATSFVTNTNWQAYGGETTMSYLTQMLALTFQNFVSAAVGMAVLIALIRGFIRSRTQELGNFWHDMVRGVVYILLPFSIIFAVILVTQGVVQTFAELRGGTRHPRVRPDDRSRSGRLADRHQACSARTAAGSST